MPKLNSLFLNLHMEDQVDMIMRNLPHLEYLNGLKVERDFISNYEGASQQEIGGLQDSLTTYSNRKSDFFHRH